MTDRHQPVYGTATPLLLESPVGAESNVKSALLNLTRHYGAKFAHGTFSAVERVLLVALVSFALTATLCNLNFNFLEANLYDFRMAHGFQTSADPEIVLVTLDDATSQTLDEFSPLPLDFHARFLEALEGMQPRAVGYLIDFNQLKVTYPDSFNDPQWALRFVDAAGRLNAKGSPVILGTPFEVTGETLPPPPLNTLDHALAVIHKDTNVFAEDKITRRAWTYLNGKPTLHLALAEKLGYTPPGFRPKGNFALPEIEAEAFLFKYHGNTALRTERGGHLPYKRVSFVEILNGTYPADAIKGKIVLVGTLSREDSGDFAFTPYSKASFANPKLLVHANILDAIIHDQGVVSSPLSAYWIQTFIVSLVVILAVLRYSPILGVVVTLGLAVLILLIGEFAFYSQGLWVQQSAPLIGIFVSYYLGVPYRLIREYKQRWDYQRKNEILTQVEELKTNFLNLVTHDLKSPVARIQGLAEVILRKSSERLIDRDKETLHHILDATDELNRFISSILELSKVESNRLQLQKESKDINQLIERLVDNFKAQSRSRKIKVTTQLEPLFPIRIDANLMTKVLANLIDNAIKYSFAGSEVRIESREVDADWVEIAIHDQGIGMTAEEREHLFTRFYRAKNDTTTQIAGTGLGLYLTKFFIEAHNGRVEVESEKGRGSVFRVFLPLTEAAEKAAASRPVGLLARLSLKKNQKEKSYV